jgi:hypothetical protein
MLETIFGLSRRYIQSHARPYKRYFLQKKVLDNRLAVITGQRGVGKTTAMIQFLLTFDKDAITSEKTLYVPCDHLLVGETTLYDIAEEFTGHGGLLLALDEIHKYPQWSRELKSITDTFPKLTVLASGSSALEIRKGAYDLSRRAMVFPMNVLSFREFIELSLGIRLPVYELAHVLKHHTEAGLATINLIEAKGEKILALFKKYLTYGYYPVFADMKDKTGTSLILEQTIHTTLENDLMAIYPSLTGNSVRKMKKLMTVIAQSAPFTPDLQKVKRMLDVGDERTLKTYLKYFEDGGLIHCIAKGKSQYRQLEKPEKIYLDNPNYMYALQQSGVVSRGTIRETFLADAMINAGHSVSVPEHGDFLVDRIFVFEVGGKDKGFSQIRNIGNSFVASDDIETGAGNKIPLWLFGFMY